LRKGRVIKPIRNRRRLRSSSTPTGIETSTFHQAGADPKTQYAKSRAASAMLAHLNPTRR
jgi:hypothetical protein